MACSDEELQAEINKLKVLRASWLKSSKQIKSKIDELDSYGKLLYPVGSAEFDVGNENKNERLTWSKGNILQQLAKSLRVKVDAFMLVPQPMSTDWEQLGDELEEIVNAVTPQDILTLQQHRLPLVRWLKEFVALIATLFIGSIIVTVCNAYNAKEGTFSFDKIGFFSNTASMDKVNNVIAAWDPVDAMKDQNAPLEPDVGLPFGCA